MTTAAQHSRRGEILALLSAGDPDSSFLARICAVATGVLGVSGAGLCLVGGAFDEVIVHGTDHVAQELENLQVNLAQGPCLEAIRTRSPIIVDDLEGLAGSDWHPYRESALSLGARAVFCFPLQTTDPAERSDGGPLQIGALDLYRTTAGDLDPDQLADALLLADIATRSILEQKDAVDLDISLSVVGQLADDPDDADEPTIVPDLDLTVGQAFPPTTEA